ncbi:MULTISPECIES: HPP family protein [Flavobacterium]|uniref:HPP family protein n=1 Tax=Flavobacterium TaxID=237 RepID=UPI001182E6DC|nr:MULTISPECIES: HPP family protein [Flavobacterium]MCR4029631.1 HPP family protein [Flavobacterium panacis]
MNSFFLKKITLENRSSALSYIKGLILILLMVLTAEFFKDKEIILPELAALSIGCFFYNLQEWRSKPWDLFVLPAATAFIGFFINILPIPISLKLVFCVGAVLTIMFLFKNILPPALATGLLPIITNCHTWLFLASIILFTLLLALSISVSKKQISETTEHHNFKEKKIEIILFLMIVSLWFYFCISTNQLGMAAIPPVIVVALESVLKKKYSFKILSKQIFTLTTAGLIGSIILLFIENKVLAAFIAILMISGLLRMIKFRLPPAYAIALLPMVLHELSPANFMFNILIMSTSVLGVIFLLKNDRLKSILRFNFQ